MPSAIGTVQDVHLSGNSGRPLEGMQEMRYLKTSKNQGFVSETELNCLVQNYESRLSHADSQFRRAKEQLENSLKRIYQQKILLLNTIHNDPKLVQQYQARLHKLQPYEVQTLARVAELAQQPESLCKGCKLKMQQLDLTDFTEFIDDVPSNCREVKNNMLDLGCSPVNSASKCQQGSSSSTVDSLIGQRNPSLAPLCKEQIQLQLSATLAEKLSQDAKIEQLTQTIKHFKQKTDSYASENIRLRNEVTQLRYQTQNLKDSHYKYEQVQRYNDKLQMKEATLRDRIRCLEGKVESEAKAKRLSEVIVEELNQTLVRNECQRLNNKYKARCY